MGRKSQAAKQNQEEKKKRSRILKDVTTDSLSLFDSQVRAGESSAGEEKESAWMPGGVFGGWRGVRGHK